MKQVEETITNVLRVYGGEQEQDSQQQEKRKKEADESIPEPQKEDERTSRRPRKRQKKDTSIQAVPAKDREAVVIARCLQTRLEKARQQDICQRCWLQRSYCFCADIPPIEDLSTVLPHSRIRRMFVLLHYKEVFMGVDTAKLILATFPCHVRLVIANISSDYQASMAELEHAMKTGRVCVLFPDEEAKTVHELLGSKNKNMEEPGQPNTQTSSCTSTAANNDSRGDDDDDDDDDDDGWDVVVIDGTWQQARRMKGHYFSNGSSSSLSLPKIPTVKLSEAALRVLDQVQKSDEDSLPAAGHQLRKHCIPWKRIATFEAVRLFLLDCCLLASSSQSHPPPKKDNAEQQQEQQQQEQQQQEQEQGLLLANGHPAAAPEWIVQLQQYVSIANAASLSRNEPGSGWKSGGKRTG